jgi:ubiquinone/menaquinone biosynthesis C-methylase UbiE
MNLIHRWVCGSGRWKKAVETKLLPWALKGVDLGTDVLEIGPGYGATTEVLRKRAVRLTCLEIDRALADSLSRRTSGTNVMVIQADATRMPLPDASFTGAVCFTMLHHVPSVESQDRLLAEVVRVLRPGGVFAGSDSRTSALFRLIHAGDVLTPVDPGTFGKRLEAAGFTEITVDAAPRIFRFRARRA